MSDATPTDRAAVLRLLEEMREERRPFDLPTVERIERFFKGLPDDEASTDLVRALLNVQHLLEQQLLFQKAVPIALKAIHWARILDDHQLLARALVCRGMLASDSGDLSTAFENYVEGLQGYTALNYEQGMAVTYYNLGGLMKRLGRDAAAVICMKKTLELASEIGKDGGIKGAAFSGMSDLHLRQGDYRAALVAARCAQEIFARTERVTTHVGCAIQREISARVYLLDFDGAREALERLEKLAQEFPSGYADGYVTFSRAILDGFMGETESAAIALRAFEHWTEQRQDALRCLVDIYERSGQASNALAVTNELLEYLRAASRQVTQVDLERLSISSEEGDDLEIQDLIARSARFKVELREVGDLLHAKLAYLFELAVNAELREDSGPNPGEHIYRVGRLSVALASESGYDDETCWLAEIAGRLHDIGKTSTPTHVIMKTDPLSKGEMDVVRLHAEDGAALLSGLGERRLARVVSAVRHHHENWDGSGYPSQLQGEQIPLLARIVALADAFDAMTHSRPFRAPRTTAVALEEVARRAGHQFDPVLSELFGNVVRRLEQEHANLDDFLGEHANRTRWSKSHPELLRLLGIQHPT